VLLGALGRIKASLDHAEHYCCEEGEGHDRG
jgi:hypothetical protein